MSLTSPTPSNEMSSKRPTNGDMYVAWLGYSWDDRLCFASDYFEEMHKYAVQLIEQGDAYVCDLSSDEIRKSKGGLTEAGENSPNRERSIEENLDTGETLKYKIVGKDEADLKKKFNLF